MADTALVRCAKQGAIKVRDDMKKPNQDWMPTLLYRNADNGVNIVGLVLGDGKPGAVGPDDITRAGEFVTQRLRQEKAVEAVLVAGVWLKSLCGDCTKEHKMEGVMVAQVTRDQCQVEVAQVQRTMGLPDVGDWQVVAQDLEVGPMVIIDAMRASI